MDKSLKRRILEIAFKHKCSHLGSCLSSVNIIDNIYSKMQSTDDIFILSSGHSGLALYTVIEKYYGINANILFENHGVHPYRDEERKIYCSTGSLGMGITVAVGRALANKKRNVHVLLSDGECEEGSVWESLRFIKENNLENIKVYVSANGYCAYDSMDINYLEKRLKAFLPEIKIIKTNVNQLPFLRGLNAHYHIMSKEDLKFGLKILT